MDGYQALCQHGIEKARQADFQSAIAYFGDAIQLQPESAEAYYQRGLAFFNVGNAQQAISDYASAMQRQPDRADFYFGRGLAYLTLGNLREALTDANQAVRLDTAHAAAYSLRGAVCQRLGDLTEAIASYKQAAHLYLDQKDATNCRYCLEQIERLKSPTPQVQASAQTPQVQASTELRSEMAAFLQQAMQKAKQGNQAAAIADLDWAIQIDPQDARAYFSRAEIYADRRDWSTALHDYQQAARLFADRSDKAMLKQVIEAIEHLKATQTRTTTVYRIVSPPPLVLPTRPLSWEIQRKLLGLTAYDRQIAIRLVNQLKLRNPGLPEDWYWEKAIYDLERDRI